MNRWYVTFPEGIIKFYADSAEHVKRIFPDAIAVDPCDDPEYLYYAEEILNHVTSTIKPNFYIVHTWFGDFIYNQFVDEDGNKIDGGKWRRVEPLRTIVPVLWDLGNPKMFYDKYLADYDEIAPFGSRWTRIDYLEWAKVKKRGRFKALKISNPVDKSKYWANAQGVVYEIDRQNSKAKKAWQEYKSNPMAFANAKTPYNPDLSKNCFRMPYVPILNQNISIHDMALIWRKRMHEELSNNIDYRVFCRGKVCYDVEFLEKIIEEARNAFYN